MKRYTVNVECKTTDNRVRRSYGGMQTFVLVFASDREGARRAAVDKMKDKWLRHQGLRTEWMAHEVIET